MPPELAQYYLDRNFHNRPLDEEKVSEFVSVIENEKWICGRGRNIDISSKDTLLNGQHRLSAIVRSGKSVEVIVSRRVVQEWYNTKSKVAEKMRIDSISIQKFDSKKGDGYKNKNVKSNRSAKKFVERFFMKTF